MGKKIEIGKRVKVNACDLPEGGFVGIVRGHSGGALNHQVEIVEPKDFDGHFCDGVTPNGNGWNCHTDELEEIE